MKWTLVLTHRPTHCNLSHRGFIVVLSSGVHGFWRIGRRIVGTAIGAASMQVEIGAQKRETVRHGRWGRGRLVDAEYLPANYRNENGRAWRARFPPRRKNGIRDWRRRSCVRGRFRPASRARDKASRDQAPILRVPARSGCDSAPPASNATTAGRGCAPASRVRRNALFAKQRNRYRGRKATRESLPVGNRPIRPQPRKQMQPGCN